MRLQVSPVAPYSPLVAPRAATMTLGGHSESPPLRLRLRVLQFQEQRGSRRKAVVDQVRSKPWHNLSLACRHYETRAPVPRQCLRAAGMKIPRRTVLRLDGLTGTVWLEMQSPGSASLQQAKHSVYGHYLPRDGNQRRQQKVWQSS